MATEQDFIRNVFQEPTLPVGENSNSPPSGSNDSTPERMYRAERVRDDGAYLAARSAGYPESFFTSKDDPWRNVEPWTSQGRDTWQNKSMLGRAYAILDGLDIKESHPVRRTLEDVNQISGAARMIVALASPEYLSAFRAMIWAKSERVAGTTVHFPGPELTTREMAAVQRVHAVARSLNEGSGTAGGLLVPFYLDPAVTLSSTSSAGPVPNQARTVTTTSNTWNSVTSLGAAASWQGSEGSAASTGQDPVFDQFQISTHPLTSWIAGSFEVIEDLAGSDWAAQLNVLLADASGRLLEDAFVNGNGTDSPFGLAVRASQTASATTGALVADDVYALHKALGFRFRNDGSAAFLASVGVADALRRTPAFTGSSKPLLKDVNKKSRLLGVPFYEVNSLPQSPSPTGNVVLLYGSFDNYVVANRLGATRLVYSESLSAAGTNRPAGEAGWLLTQRVGADVSVSATGTGAPWQSLST